MNEYKRTLDAIADVISIRNESTAITNAYVVKSIGAIISMHDTIIRQRAVIDEYSEKNASWREIINGCFAKANFSVSNPDQLRGLDLSLAAPK